MSDPDYLIKGWTQGSHDACVVRIRALEHDIAELEAEVERLKTDLIWWALHASSVHRCDHNIEGGGRESESLSARKVTPKTDDAPTAPCPNCGAELTWFKHAWARKERASSD